MNVLNINIVSCLLTQYRMYLCKAVKVHTMKTLKPTLVKTTFLKNCITSVLKNHKVPCFLYRLVMFLGL